MDLLSIVNTGLAAINDVQGFARSVKQAEALRERLQAKLSSTQLILDNLKKRVEDLGGAENNGPSGASASADSGTNGTQSVLKQNDIDTELETLQSTVEIMRKRLATRSNSSNTKTIGGRIKQVSRREKEEREIQALLEDVSEVYANALALSRTISLAIRLRNLQRSDEDERERKGARLEAERSDREEKAREEERRRQETERQQLEAERVRREEDARREDAERWRQEFEKQELEKQRKELIEWLKPYDYNSKHQSSTQLRQEGTCGWLLENETFRDWRSDSGSNFLWLYGIPGSGKTILFSKVVDNLEKLGNTTVIYHYCDFMNADSLVPSTVLRSIFVQLLRRTDIDWLAEFKDLSTAKKEGKSPPSILQDLANLIQRAAKFHQRTVIAIDALDECQRESSDRRSLLHYIDLIRKHGLSLFVTSRDEYDIHTAFRGLSSISLDNVKANIESDIKMFISNELSARPRLSDLREGLRDKIMRLLSERSQGLFHWVHCQIAAIDDCLTEQDILVELQTLPRDLNHTYERILRKILSQGPRAIEMTRRILLWLVGASRPLHILELYEAIMIEPEGDQLNERYRVMDPMDIPRACGSLIQSFSSADSFDGIDSIEYLLDEDYLKELFPNRNDFQNYERTYLRLSHYTVKEFLQTAQLEDSRIAVYHFPPAIANHDVAILILTYLTQDVFDHLEISSRDSEPLSDHFYYHDNFDENLFEFIGKFKIGIFFSYGWTNWESHLLHETDSGSLSLYRLLRLFFEKRLGQICRDIPTLRKANLTVDVDNKYIYALLLLAMSNGIRWLIQLLLNDSPINDHLNPCNSRSPRIMGMEKDETDAVEVLIQGGTFLNTLDMYDDPLFDAASGGYLELSWVLIQAGVNPNAADILWGKTTLHNAASEGYLEISTMLVQAGVDPNAVDRGGRIALHDAALWGYLEISTMLIQAGANPSAADEEGETTLHSAASRGHLEVSTMLIQAGANPNAVNESGSTALHSAAYRGHLEVSTMLIQAGANPNAVNESGRTALHDAASRGDLETSTMLIQAGANPNAVDEHGRTALHDSASRDYLEVSTMLIQAGANPSAADEEGETTLHHAASGGHLEISKLLIQANADPLSKNNSGKTPLHIAIDLHSKPIVEYLLSNGGPLADLGLLYDEQVQWAQELPWYSQLSLREFDYSAPVDEEVDVIPSRSVLEVRWMLHEMLQLPSEVVSRILDLSEYWAHSFIWRKDQIVTSSIQDVSYLSVKLRSKGSGSLRKIVFTTKSHEVDSFSNPSDEPVYNRHRTRFEVTVTSPTGRPSLERRLIQLNVSNSSINRIHVNTWEYKDHADWMDKIHPGDLISVHAKRGLFEKNIVEFVRMDIYCAW